MDQFLKGRAAISAKDKKGQDSAVAEIKVLWEKVAAGTVCDCFSSSRVSMFFLLF